MASVLSEGASNGSLRAGVLGANDGLVSNFSLVMGVSGGTGNTDFVLLAGVAGLLAGAFSMAAGEYVSMNSQKEAYQHRLRLKEVEIAMRPEEEEEKLALVYQAKGLSREDAQLVALRYGGPGGGPGHHCQGGVGAEPVPVGFALGRQPQLICSLCHGGSL